MFVIIRPFVKDMRKLLGMFKRYVLPPIIVGFICTFFFLAAAFNWSTHTEQQFSYLAKSVLAGSFSFLEMPGENFLDTAFYNGEYFWPLGPFPALILVPFVFLFQKFNLFFYQGYLQFFLTAGIFWLCYWLARHSGFQKRASLILAFAFCFASVYQAVALIPWSWHFVQVISVFLVLLSLREFFTARRYLFIGLAFACIFMTRFTAGFGILFFIAHIIHTHERWGVKMRQLAYLCAPVAIAGAVLLGYNSVRFNNPFENGYRIVNNATLSEAQRFETLHYGLFQLRNIPTNLYYYFVKSPDPVRVQFESWQGNTYVLRPPYVTVAYPGISFFFVAPIFLYCFRTRHKEYVVRLALIPISVILIALLLYYWPGWRQVGPRYLLDLLPFAYLLLLYSFPEKKLSRVALATIGVSAFTNLYFLTTVFW